MISSFIDLHMKNQATTHQPVYANRAKRGKRLEILISKFIRARSFVEQNLIGPKSVVEFRGCRAFQWQEKERRRGGRLQVN